MTESQAIAEIVSTLLSHGPVYSGGDQQTAERIAGEWYDLGFDAKTTDDWCAVGCWTPSVAADFFDACMMPSSAAKACRMYDYRQAHADSMYAACNGDLAAADIIAFYKAQV